MNFSPSAAATEYQETPGLTAEMASALEKLRKKTAQIERNTDAIRDWVAKREAFLTPHFGRVVDLSASPYDLRPAIDGIVAQVIDAMEAATPDQPVVLVMGESHNVAIQKLMQQGVMKRLHQMGIPFAFGYEHSHALPQIVLKDSLPWLTEMRMKRPYCRSLKQYFQRDPLKLAMALWPRPYAVESRDQVFAFCLKYKIATSFNDAARNRSNSYLDLTDKETRRTALLWLGEDKQSISLLSPDSTTIRNIKTIGYTYRHIKRLRRSVFKNVRNPLYIHHCGFNHVLGRAKFDRDQVKAVTLRYEFSLSGLFARTGALTIPLIIENRDEKYLSGIATIPDQAFPMLKQGILIEGLDNTYFETNMVTKLSQQTGHPELLERQYIARVAAASGDAIEVFDLTERRQVLRKRYEDRLFSPLACK